MYQNLLHLIENQTQFMNDLPTFDSTCMGYVGYVANHKTITLGVPRQCGKTKAMLELLSRDSSAIMFTFNNENARRLKDENPKLADRIFGSPKKALGDTRGIRGKFTNARTVLGIPARYYISKVLVEEYECYHDCEKEAFWDFIDVLKVGEFVDEKFHVIMIETPRHW